MPRAVEILAKTLSDALDQQTHRLARDFEKAFHPQHVMLLGDGAQSGDELLWIADGPDIENEAFEFVVIVFGLVIVMRFACFDFIFRRRFQPEQQFGIDLAFARDDNFDRAGQNRRDLLARLRPSHRPSVDRSC